MEYAVFQQAIVTIYEQPAVTKRTELGICSAISDEGIYGMMCRIEGLQDRWARIRTHYGYSGYVMLEGLMMLSEEEVESRKNKHFMVVNAFCADIMSIPDVHGFCMKNLNRGSVLEVLKERTSAEGWTRVRLLSGKEGYIRSQYLIEKRFPEWSCELNTDEVFKTCMEDYYDGSEEAFRDNLESMSRSYLGVQYRWGGKTTKGIDCSGFASMVYMLAGILIFRDAKLEAGFPIKEVPYEERKKGDLLYFPGHIAIYLGDDKYIHSTGRIGFGGVVINSLNPADEDYREDLKESLYAVGGLR